MSLPETHESDHPEPSRRNYVLQKDGSGTGTLDHPVEGAIGVVRKDADGHKIDEISEPIGPAINTVAEYRVSSKASSSPAVAESNGFAYSSTRSSWSTR
jgi:hypothetical protein